VREVLLADGIQPDFEHGGDEYTFIDFIHRASDNVDFYFIANRNNRLENIECTFRCAGRQAEFWDPVTGDTRRVTLSKETGGRTSIPIELAPHQALFVIFKKKSITNKRITSPKAAKNSPSLKTLQVINGTWTVKFDPKWGGPATTQFPRLIDWKDHEEDGIKYYSGTATYVKEFYLSQSTATQKLFLDLGVVKNIASVRLNGNDLGIIWTAPWRVDITRFVKPRENVLEIEVTNLWVNRLIGDAALPPEKRFTQTNIELKKDAPLLSSGLLGPVAIQAEKGI
jgi:hypothetical protein